MINQGHRRGSATAAAATQHRVESVSGKFLSLFPTMLGAPKDQQLVGYVEI